MRWGSHALFVGCDLWGPAPCRSGFHCRFIGNFGERSRRRTSADSELGAPVPPSICRANRGGAEAQGRVACARTLRGADADAAPKTRLPLGHRSAKVARCDNQKPLRPTYPCEDCANLVPYYYCDACRATWDDRQRAERERINAKQRERRARRREMKRPALCATCGAARTPASAFELSRRADGAW